MVLQFEDSQASARTTLRQINLWRIMLSDERRSELTKFLRARREAIAPSTLGLKPTGRRRTPGLRREEVAGLAGVSVTWYTWLEQGRDIQCSADLLGRLSRALTLSASDTDYLFRLASFSPPMRASACGIDPSLQTVLDNFVAGPAFVLGPRLDVLAFNSIADAIFEIDGHACPLSRNHLWRGFMDPGRRDLYLDWAEMMSEAVAFLRACYATRIGDEAFEALISTLRRDSAGFQRMWEERRTQSIENVPVRLRHKVLGPLNFVSCRLAVPTRRDHIAVFVSPADGPTKRALSKLPLAKLADRCLEKSGRELFNAH